jgi:hypothetical protein
VGPTKRATATIYPVKVRHYEADWHCDVQAVVGYRAACHCGWRSSTFASVQIARTALRNHREAEHAAAPEAATPTSETAA